MQIYDRDFTPEAELRAVADSLERWLPDHPEWTVAVLSPRNKRGFELVEVLKHRDIPHFEMLRSTSVTRDTAGALGNLLRCLADPTSAKKLSVAFQVWRRGDREDPEAKARGQAVASAHGQVPGRGGLSLAPGRTRLAGSLLPRTGLAGSWNCWRAFEALPAAGTARPPCPSTSCLLTLAGDLFQEPPRLALAHKLALLLRDVAGVHPAYRLTELVEELAVIARNERRFLGFANEDSGFEPPKGQVTVTTMHKAKGLEWDRVYLLSANNYDFPSGLDHDTYMAERWFVRDRLNLQAEALAQLAWIAGEPAADGTAAPGDPVIEGRATYQARLAYISERLRLFYVGITRAKRDLIITWNTGHRREAQPSVPFVALHEYWQNKLMRRQRLMPESEGHLPPCFSIQPG